jgi:chromatin remodeling complex protein RSC6
MVRASKSTEKSSSSAQSVSAPVSVTNELKSTAELAKGKTKESKPRAKKAAVSSAPAEPVTTLTSTEADVVVAATDAAPALIGKLTEFSAKLQQLNSVFSAVKGDFKTLEKLMARELKAAQKSSGKKTKRTGNRAPSGFVKPTLISDELANFLGKAVGTEMARTAVSKEINAYIRNNNLQDKTNGRIIVPDSKLATLLKTQPSDELTYFNLQRFMKHHFVKAEAPAATA